ncbi:MAG: Asp-tRNA(Asn)/Glu-tRNA(Gln) amidotransferase subunit GatB [Verrucomicrobiales bacterium]
MPIADYIPTIGLEIHVHLKTRSKMFCSCATSYGDEPNTRTCPTCLGLPGALPVLNEEAIRLTILTGQLLEATTPAISKWDRKNYFYADMPKNYQTSQYDQPLVVGGGIPMYDQYFPKGQRPEGGEAGVVGTIPLTRIHLEEDAGKSVHFGASSGLDFNRAGTPLMEIVTEPAIRTADEAAAVLASLRQILVYAGVSDADMERGQMRCDVNVSVRRAEGDPLGAKIELKNLNSVAAVRRAIQFEILRQTGELDRGVAQRQETRRWDDERGESTDMRGKEDAHDYRYFPDPDLLPVRTEGWLAEVRQRLPELPHAKRARFVRDHALTPYDAGVLTSEPALAHYFEEAVAGSAKPKAVANWIINELLGRLNDGQTPFSENPVTASALRELVGLVDRGAISGAQAKEVFAEMFSTRAAPAEIVKAKGYTQVTDTGEIDAFVQQAIAASPDLVARIKAGESKVVNVLVGQVMKASGGKANPKIVSELLSKALG